VLRREQMSEGFELVASLYIKLF